MLPTWNAFAQLHFPLAGYTDSIQHTTEVLEAFDDELHHKHWEGIRFEGIVLHPCVPQQYRNCCKFIHLPCTLLYHVRSHTTTCTSNYTALDGALARYNQCISAAMAPPYSISMIARLTYTPPGLPESYCSTHNTRKHTSSVQKQSS